MNRYIEALQKLPLRRLTVLDLAWKFTKPDGTLDEDQMSFNMAEIEQAVTEARGYVEDTRKAVKLLWRLQQLTS